MTDINPIPIQVGQYRGWRNFFWKAMTVPSLKYFRISGRAIINEPNCIVGLNASGLQYGIVPYQVLLLKLLIVMPSKYVGNMVITMQPLAAVIERYGDAAVTLLVDDTFADLTSHYFPNRCRLLFYPRRAAGGQGVLMRARCLLAFVRSLRSVRFDRIVDFDGTVISARITRLAKSAEKIGPGYAKRPAVYDRIVAMDRDAQHCIDDYRLMAEAVDAPLASDQYLPLPPIPDSVWTSPLPAGDRVACIHPCATKDYKQWDIEKFASLADKLLERGWLVCLVGAGSAEQDRIKAMLDAMKRTPINLHGQLNLMQLAWLFQHADLFIGNDSGPMHLAAASGVRVIALFGPTELLRWQPRAPGVRVVKGLEPCSPACRPEACLYNYRCLRSLTVEQVLKETGDS